MDTAFSGDEQFALTCSTDRTIRIWRVADGAEVGNFSCKGEVRYLRFSALLLSVVLRQVDGMSFHEASGLLAANVRCNGTVLFRYSPDGPSLPPPSTPNRRGRRQLAARKLSAIQERIASFEPSVGAAAAKERSLADEATRLKDRRTHLYVLHIRLTDALLQSSLLNVNLSRCARLTMSRSARSSRSCRRRRRTL